MIVLSLNDWQKMYEKWVCDLSPNPSLPIPVRPIKFANQFVVAVGGWLGQVRLGYAMLGYIRLG